MTLTCHEPAYPLGPRFAGPRQGLAGGCAPFDPPASRTAAGAAGVRGALPPEPRRARG